eukprot:scaffold31464_cov79-Isochrysis_galbana.AAC.1
MSKHHASAFLSQSGIASGARESRLKDSQARAGETRRARGLSAWGSAEGVAERWVVARHSRAALSPPAAAAPDAGASAAAGEGAAAAGKKPMAGAAAGEGAAWNGTSAWAGVAGRVAGSAVSPSVDTGGVLLSGADTGGGAVGVTTLNRKSSSFPEPGSVGEGKAAGGEGCRLGWMGMGVWVETHGHPRNI